MGNRFLGQEYTDWSQIELPYPKEYISSFRNNPSLALNFKQFSSDSYIWYERLQKANSVRVGRW